MSANATAFNVIDSNGASRLVCLMQDESIQTTIHGVFSGTTHDLTGCTASADGISIAGTTQVFFVPISVNITIAPSRVSIARVSIVASVFGDIGGAISDEDAAALIGFVKACALPLIAA